MPLPKVSVPTDTVEVDGQTVHVRALTRGENAKVAHFIDKQDIAAAEVYILACATDTPEHETRDWYNATPSGVVDQILLVVKQLTSPSEEDHKSDS